MRLWCWPGATFELGQLKVLVAPPDRMAALLELPEIVQFHTRYLYRGCSAALARTPPIRSEHFEPMAYDTLDGLMAAVRSSFHTVLILEWDPALAAGDGTEERGRRVARLAAALRRRAESAIVIVYAPAMDDGVRQLSAGADQTVWLVPAPDEARPAVAVAARSKAQRTLAEAGWGGSS